MKIKKTIIAVLLSSMMLTFSACGNSIPEGMSEEVYDYGVKALNVMDKYNDMEISKDDAYSRLDAIYDKLDSLDNGDTFVYAGNVQTDILTFKAALTIGKNSSKDTYEAADELRETLEIKK